MVYKFIENITGLGIIVNDHIAEKLHKLVNEYKNTYHHFINKKPINVDYSAWTGKSETNPKAPKFKVNDRVRVIKYNNIFSKENWKLIKRNIYYEINDLNREKMKGCFYEKEFSQSIL